MAGSVNRVTLLGNLGNDPEVRHAQSGSKIVTFNIATSETWKDKSTGERKERVEWTRVVIFNEPLGDVAERFLRKGSKVYIEGQLETRKWKDQSGQDRYTTEVVLRPYRGVVTLLDRKDDSDQPAGGYGQQGARQSTTTSPARTQPGRPEAGGWEPSSDLDDEIPF